MGKAIRWSTSGVLLGALVVVALAPASAGATTAAVDGPVLWYTATVGEGNHQMIRHEPARYVVYEAGIGVGLGCAREDVNGVLCADAGSPPLEPIRAGEQVSACCDGAAGGDALFAELSEVLGRHVAFDGAIWFATDPATMLATCPARIDIVEGGTSKHCETFWDREFLAQDANLFRDVARRSSPAASLHAATDEHPARSTRWREFLEPQGYDDELRVAFRAGDWVWALAALFRARGRPSFTAAETDLVAGIAGHVAQSLRSHALLPGAGQHLRPNAPGMITFAADGTLISLNDYARGWLDELPAGPQGPSLWGLAMPLEMLTVLGRARAVADGTERGAARLRLRSRTGQWLVVHASSLRDASGAVTSTAVIIESAQAAEVAPIIVAAYELTAREQQITQLIAHGLGTGEIATRLYLSAHTVRDHIKAVFEKVGVSTRGELVAQLFAEHYAPELHKPGAVVNVPV
jgi:DNA-binding CsgD family transcriptional regulator